jgi:hypothetical protein
MGADVYALACLAYEVLTGSRLFPSTTERGVIQAHVAHDGYPSKLQLGCKSATHGLCRCWRASAPTSRRAHHRPGAARWITRWAPARQMTWPLRSR